MISNNYKIFFLVCLASKFSDATLERLQLYYSPVSVTTCVVVPVQDEIQEELDKNTAELKFNFNHTHLNDSSSLTEESHRNMTKNSNNSMPAEEKQLSAELKLYIAQNNLLIQYFAKPKENKQTQFYAGECQIGPEYLQQGYHKLSIQETTHNKKLWLEVWMDDQKIHFESNMNRPIWSNMYESSYIEILGPADFDVLEESVCNDMLDAMAQTSDHVPYQMAVVATSIMTVLMLLSIVALLLARRYCKSDFLPLAGHHAPPTRVQHHIAGFDESYSGSSLSRDFQYQTIDS